MEIVIGPVIAVILFVITLVIVVGLLIYFGKIDLRLILAQNLFGGILTG